MNVRLVASRGTMHLAIDVVSHMYVESAYRDRDDVVFGMHTAYGSDRPSWFAGTPARSTGFGCRGPGPAMFCAWPCGVLVGF